MANSDDVSADKRPKPLQATLDPERESAMQHLQDAFADGKLTLAEFDERMELVQNAEVRREIEVLLDDIPGDYALVPVAASEKPPTPFKGDGAMQLASDVEPLRLTAFFGGSEKEGRWRAPPEIFLKAIFGGVELDLRDAELGPVTTIHCNAVFGGIEIEVPDTVRVESTGSGFFGGFSGKKLPSPSGDVPVVRIVGRAVFGGVDVVQKKRKRRGSRGKKPRDRHDSSGEYPAAQKRKHYDSDEYPRSERKRRDSSDEFPAV